MDFAGEPCDDKHPFDQGRGVIKASLEFAAKVRQIAGTFQAVSFAVDHWPNAVPGPAHPGAQPIGVGQQCLAVPLRELIDAGGPVG